MRRTREECLRRDVTISVRVSREERERIRKKAAREEKTTSEYVLDSAMAGLERRNSKDRKRIGHLIRNQEILNDIYELLEKIDVTDELHDKFNELVEGENRLWQCL